MAEFKYEIKKEFGKLSDKNGYSKEFNLISYNGKTAGYDIRNWYTDEETGEKKLMKGISLNKEEAEKLRDLLNEVLKS